MHHKNGSYSEAITFVHLTDTHILPSAEARLFDTDTYANLQSVLERIREMNVNPAFILVSGDISQGGEEGSYARFAELKQQMDGFGVPVLMGLGNHDTRIHFRRVILGEMDANDEEAPYYHSQTIQGIRVTMLDSKVPGATHGHIDMPQLEWLAEQLEEPAPQGHLLVVHHPVVPRGIPRDNDYLIDNADALAEIITGHNILGILAGHTHVSTAAPFGATLAINGPATAFHLDPSIRSGGRILSGAGFGLGTVREGRLLVNAVYMPGDQRELYRYFPQQVEQHA